MPPTSVIAASAAKPAEPLHDPDIVPVFRVMVRSGIIAETDPGDLWRRPEDYPEEFPPTADLDLIVEVADSSLAVDRDQADGLAREEAPVIVDGREAGRVWDRDLLPCPPDPPRLAGASDRCDRP